MDTTKILTNNQGNSNKFWKYEIENNTTVTFSWGRIGLDGQSKTETFLTNSKMETKILKKMAEKQKKGYIESDNKKLKKESEIARLIGAKNKINEMHFVCVSSRDTYKEIKQYDPDQSVLVEIMDSWSKEKTYFLFNKKKSWRVNIDLSNNKILDKTWAQPAIVEGLRKSFEAIATVVKVAVQKFGSLGIRSLKINDDIYDTTTNSIVEDVFSNVGESVSKQVISKFAALGSRVLKLD